MPHIIKRFVNTLEFSNPGDGHARELTMFSVTGLAMPLCLSMIYDIWVKRGGRITSQLRTTKLTTQHFFKNCWSRMRVKFAVQVVSDSVVRMLLAAIDDRQVPNPLM